MLYLRNGRADWHGTKQRCESIGCLTYIVTRRGSSRSSMYFRGHAGWKINDLNPISVRLLGRSQLSNPSDSYFAGTVIKPNTEVTSLPEASRVSDLPGYKPQSKHCTMFACMHECMHVCMCVCACDCMCVCSRRVVSCPVQPRACHWNCVSDTISVAWSERARQLAAGGVAPVWRKWWPFSLTCILGP